MQGDSLHEMSSPNFWGNKKTNMKMSSAEILPSMLNINIAHGKWGHIALSAYIADCISVDNLSGRLLFIPAETFDRSYASHFANL